MLTFEAGRYARGSFLCALLGVITCASGAAQKQSGGQPSAPTVPPVSSRPPVMPSYPGNTPNFNQPYFPGVATDGMLSPEQVSGLIRLQQRERQKQVVRATDRLVSLTVEYQRSIQTSGPTPESEKKLKEIEKLAKEVRTTLLR